MEFIITMTSKIRQEIDKQKVKGSQERIAHKWNPKERNYNK